MSEINLDVQSTIFERQLNQAYEKAELIREKESLSYPANLLLMVEGTTEEKLLPIFSEKMGLDFAKAGLI